MLVILFLAASVGCRAQTPAPQAGDSKLDRQIKLTIRSQYNVPPDYTVTLGQRTKSDISGFDNLPVNFSNNHGQKKTTAFLISKDNNTLARLEKFDLTRTLTANISILGRPVRGNPKAKVTLISFDDLECPFCARMHEVLFPATEKHYGALVRYVYKDFPLPMHPWAMHAAVDVNCLAAQSPAGYWNLVDTIHGHRNEIAGEGNQQSLAITTKKLDDATRAEGKLQHVDIDKLNSCITKQDDSAIRDSIREGGTLGVDGTPTLFINGERASGALSQDMLWTIIDRAITDAGEVPPPQENPGKTTAVPGK
ncbi:MAG: thioredoxin domain-containing protein [Acidobacteriaceae bacterium]